MRVYIAGPMSGRPQFNYPAFAEMAKDLRKEVVNPGEHIIVTSPAELDSPSVQAWASISPDGVLPTGGPSHGTFLGRAVHTIIDGEFDAIVVLPEWWTSKGARVEVMAGLVSGARICNVQHHYGGRSSLYEMTRGELLRGLEGGA